MYRLEVSVAADHDLAKLEERISRQDFDRLRGAIKTLAIEPRPNGVRKIKGTERSYRIRVGSFRIIYKIYDDIVLVLILQVLRKNETTYRN